MKDCDSLQANGFTSLHVYRLSDIKWKIGGNYYAYIYCARGFAYFSAEHN